MKTKLLAILTLSLIVSGCSALAADPTITPEPSPTLVPTTTSTTQPTATSTPTVTLTPVPSPDKIMSLAVVDGLTISVPVPLQYQVNGNKVVLITDAADLNISFVGDSQNNTQPLTKVIDAYLASLEKRGWKFTKGTSEDIQIDGVTGLALNVTGTTGDIIFEGEAVAASPKSGYVLFGLGVSKTNSDLNSWKDKGQATFNDLIQTIKFTNTNAVCPISTDKTYGYKENNPIKVGGGDFDGPSRERAYLDHLQGPHGEKLTYDRNGSMPSGDVILDIFHISGSGINATVYVDEYNYSDPQAPVGFSCEGAFPLSTP